MTFKNDAYDYRYNVAALVRVRKYDDPAKMYISCQRRDFGSWQCPQGGMETTDSSPCSALLRELEEELGIKRESVTIIHESRFWRRYQFGKNSRKRNEKYKGQQQKWFLCEIDSLDDCHLEISHGEFVKIQLVGVRDFLHMYPGWKAPPFLDFCRELGFYSNF